MANDSIPGGNGEQNAEQEHEPETGSSQGRVREVRRQMTD